MKRCCRCVMPDTAPNIIISFNGLCNHCIAHDENQKINWGHRWIKLNELCDSHRRNNSTYDSVIAISGGKDSYYQVGLFKEKLGMNPLCVSLDNYSWTKTGRQNIKNLNERFDVDIVTFTPARKTLKYHTRKDFEDYLHPNKYWDKLLYKLPFEIAKQYGIKLIIWGEDTQYRNTSDAGVLHNAWNHFSYYDIIFTSYYVPWNRYDNLKYAAHNGFKSLGDTREWERYGLEYWDFEQVDTIGYLINNYCKFIKFGYSTVTELCSDAIRQEKMSRSIAIEMINDNDWKIDSRMLLDFCQFIEMEPEQFWDVIDWHANQKILEKRDGQWRLKENAM